MSGFIAEIVWAADIKSGQPVISDLPYRPIIVFADEKTPSESGAVFSAEIFNREICGKTSVAFVGLKSRKLSDVQAKIGMEFDLYEAREKAAHGKIVEILDI